MSKSTLKILPALIVAIIAASVTQPVFGQAPAPTPHELIFTEDSSTSLAVTFGGSTSGITITFIESEEWVVFLPFAITGGTAANWTEPEDSSLFNYAEFIGGSRNRLIVHSDAALFGFPHQFPLGANGTPVDFGINLSDNVAVQAVFNDNGDVAKTPDTGTTLSLFGLSLMGLTFLRRKLC